MSTIKDQLQYYRDLLDIIMKTRGARFTAARHCKTNDKLSVMTQAILSVYLTSVSVVFLAYPQSKFAQDATYFSVLSIIASIWLLVAALSDFAEGRGVKAHQLYENALDITLILRAMERELKNPAPDVKKLSELAEKYEVTIRENGVNHDPIDYISYLDERTKITGILSLLKALKFKWLDYPISVLQALPAHFIVLMIIAIGTVCYFIK